MISYFMLIRQTELLIIVDGPDCPIKEISDIPNLQLFLVISREGFFAFVLIPNITSVIKAKF